MVEGPATIEGSINGIVYQNDKDWSTSPKTTEVEDVKINFYTGEGGKCNLQIC